MLTSMTRHALPLTVLLALAACTDSSTTAPRTVPGEEQTTVSPGVHRQYGTPVKVGDGRARAYVTIDQKAGKPLEIGVALDSTAMRNLPAPMGMPMPHGDMHEYILDLPQQAPAPYKFVELDWNPQGHGDPYAEAHFDFHFYTIPIAERNAIDPTSPDYAAQAGNFPAPQYIRQNYACPCTLLNLPPVAVAVPRMGMHWIDVTSPEFNGQPFTATFITGTWNGKSIFQEPMITKSFILATTDKTIPLPAAAAASPAGYYPGAYRVTYDAQAKEYRIAITNLTWQQ